MKHITAVKEAKACETTYDISLKAVTMTDRTTGKVFHLSISNMSAC